MTRPRKIGAEAAWDRTLGTTAVNLFSPDESDVTPGDPTRIMDMGRVPPPGEATSQPARAEWWWPLALAALPADPGAARLALHGLGDRHVGHRPAAERER